jgi:hypothetical protein
MVMEYQRTKYPNEEEPIVLASQVPQLFTNIELFENLEFNSVLALFKEVKIYQGIEKLMIESGIIFRLFYLLLVFILIGLFFYCIWNYLGFTIKRIFGLNLYENLEIIGVDDKYLRSLNIEKKEITTGKGAGVEDHYLNIFIISSPFSGTKDILKHQNFEPINLSEILDETQYQKQILKKVNKFKDTIVVIEDFGYGIDNVTAGWRTLEVIEKLQRNQNKIIIISKLSPSQVIEKYETLRAKETNKDQHLDVFIAKWKDVLAEFIEMYFSYVVSSGQKNTRKKLPKYATINKILEYELGVHEPYFRQLYDSIYIKKDEKFELTNALLIKYERDSSFEKREIFKEELLLKIQTMAHPFYYSLWNACSKDEKFFLYDLATDGFANTKNTSVIIKLLEKGLIFYDESLHIMNESFRNFILSIDKAEALEMEKELNRSGNWRVYQAVIILAVVSLVFFFIFANESIVKQFSALLAGLAATIPYILRLGGFFSPASDTVKA